MARPKKMQPQVQIQEEGLVTEQEVYESLGIQPSAVLQAGFGNIEETPVVPIPTEPGPKIVNAYTVAYQLWHPFQKRMIPVNDPVPVIYDSWLDCQIKAGLVKVK